MAKVQVDFSIVDDQCMIRLNSQWFNKENPTDVISFPMNQNDADTGHEDPMLLPKLAGEIVVDEDEIKRNAEKFGVSFEQELARVVAHGVLHLYGYEDDTEEGRQAMKIIEDAVVNDFRS